MYNIFFGGGNYVSFTTVVIRPFKNKFIADGQQRRRKFLRLPFFAEINFTSRL